MHRGEEAIALLQCNYINSNYANCRRANDCSREGGSLSIKQQTRLSARYKTDNSIAMIVHAFAEYQKFLFSRNHRNDKVVRRIASRKALRDIGCRQQVTDRGKGREELREKKEKTRERRKKREVAW